MISKKSSEVIVGPVFVLVEMLISSMIVEEEKNISYFHVFPV